MRKFILIAAGLVGLKVLATAIYFWRHPIDFWCLIAEQWCRSHWCDDDPSLGDIQETGRLRRRLTSLQADASPAEQSRIQQALKDLNDVLTEQLAA